MRRIIPILAVALLTLASASAQAKVAKPSKAAAYGGYCPVAYTTMGKAMKGNPKIRLREGERRIYFSNADAKKMYEADPSKYAVGYEGWCATAMGMGKRVKSDPTLFTVHNGTTYLFSTADAKVMFDGKPDASVKMANDHWSQRASAQTQPS